MSWARIRAWERENLPHPPRKARGATAAALDTAKKAVPGLPADYLARMAETNGSASPVFAPWTVVPVRELPRLLAGLRAWPRDDGARLVAEGPVRPVDQHRAWLPFAYDGGGNLLCLDLAPAPGGHAGQVIAWYHDDTVRKVLAPSFTAWLEDHATRLETRDRVWDAARGAVVTRPTAAPDGDEALLRRIAAAVVDALCADPEARRFLPGIGVCTVFTRHGFSGANPKTGQRMRVPTRRALLLRPARDGSDDPDLVDDAAWLAEAGWDAAACTEALRRLLARLDPARPLDFPGLGVLTVVGGNLLPDGTRRPRVLSLKASPDVAAALNPGDGD